MQQLHVLRRWKKPDPGSERALAPKQRTRDWMVRAHLSVVVVRFRGGGPSWRLISYAPDHAGTGLVRDGSWRSVSPTPESVASKGLCSTELTRVRYRLICA